MRLRILLLIPATALLLQACGGDPSPTVSGASSGPASTTRSSSDREEISCADFFGELRAAVLGHLRGTEDLPLIKHVTSVAASTYASSSDQSGGQVKVPDSMCRMFGRSLRKSRTADSFPAYSLAPACAAFVERIDRECLLPLVERGEALNNRCQMSLIGLSGFRPDRVNIMQNESSCAAM